MEEDNDREGTNEDANGESCDEGEVRQTGEHEIIAEHEGVRNKPKSNQILLFFLHLRMTTTVTSNEMEA